MNEISPGLVHRPELTGVRAAAIALVIGFHSVSQLFPGGWVGVDLFFTLSAFLITSILIREISATGRIDLFAFYCRRAARLYPALLLLVVVVCPAILAASGDAAALPYNSAVTVLYLSDVARSELPSAIPAMASPYGHTWSLAVEEHFYLVWPIVLLGIARMRPRWLNPLARWAALVSVLVWVVAWFTIGGPRAYFNAFGHLLPFALGCLLALGTGSSLRPPRPWSANACLWGGLALLGLVATHDNQGGEFGATLALTLIESTGGYLLVLGATQSCSGAARWVLANRLSQWAGERSYGIYLFHTALLWLLHLPGYHVRYLVGQTAVLGAGLILAECSFRWVEDPVRQWARRYLSRRDARAEGRLQTAPTSALDPAATS